MPGRNVHNWSLVVTSGIVGYIGYTYSISPNTVLPTISGILLGVFISPDLDLAENYSVVWFPYGKLFRHRGISHFPILGTLTRLVYIYIVLSPFLFYFRIWKWIIHPIAIKIYCGLCLADFIHSLLDVIVSEGKRYRR